jgi:hypothetical protein
LAKGEIRKKPLMLPDSLPYEGASRDHACRAGARRPARGPDSRIYRVLSPDGNLILPVTSNAVKPVYEFLSFRPGLFSRDEISDHKAYYDRSSINTFSWE